MFLDPTTQGMAKLTKGEWLRKHLACDLSTDDNLQEERHDGEVDMDYEIADTT